MNFNLRQISVLQIF